LNPAVWSPVLTLSVSKASTILELRVPVESVPINTPFWIDGWLVTVHGVGLDGQPIDIYINGEFYATTTTFYSITQGHGYYHYEHPGFPTPNEYDFQTKYVGDGHHSPTESRRKKRRWASMPLLTVQ